jgi:PAP2 superfamily
MKNVLLLCGLSFCLLFTSCKKEIVPISDQELIESWLDMALHITKFTPSNSPTFASRCFGYFGLTMYESVVGGMEDHQSLSGALSGLETLPKVSQNTDYSWQLSLNTAQAEILRSIYIQTSDSNKQKIDSLEKANEARIISNIKDKNIVNSSKSFGHNVAKTVFDWSTKDGGHRGYLKNFDKKMVTKECLGCWAPALFSQSFSHFPLHPYWGENRLFVPTNDTLPIPYKIPFDTLSTSPYYLEMMEIYNKGNTLTLEEKQTAIWWSDDPDSTYTPPGHSVFLLKNALRDQKKDIFESAKIYAAVGMGLADAYVKCWKWKYHYFSERPNAYINKYIDQRWESFWPDPPFPAFPSGHAIQGSVAAQILTHFFGESYAFDDTIHEGRYWDDIREVEFVSRKFTTFKAMADQCANSRFLGGIHMPQDNKAGIEQGEIIGNNVLNLPWKK